MSTSLPIGTVVAFACPAYSGPTSKIPEGWLLCDGDHYSVTEYRGLADLLEGTCGTAPPGRFRVPDYRGLFLRGVDEPKENEPAGRDKDAATRTMMAPGGSTGRSVNSVQAGATMLPVVPFMTDDAGNHTHAITGGKNIKPSLGGPMHETVIANASNTKEGGLHRHEIQGGDKETRPINAYVNWIILAR